ncbi:hypothetical protein CERZMDRAFT_97826 [Cercospora zeae-maydis SCOH1-5]|uniref:Uncharacterized protein n=1 Tax=Cercospora zeae-maydis SCOH1-5 TaxID=717836 RepID=A0A6A6FET4_9PEZI|nr:hypothetical protein CERZMDRAFT_97826 [Cercospora zeae-maydis SCOH1-5]
MAPKKRTHSDASENDDDWTADIFHAAMPGLPFVAPSTPLATDQGPLATPWSTMTDIPAETRSQRRRLGMTHFGSPAGGPTAKGSGYGYELCMPLYGSPGFTNPLQRANEEQRREASMESGSQRSARSIRRSPIVPGTPTPHQQHASVTNGQYGNTFLPRPEAEDSFGASEPTALPRSGSYGDENARLQAARLPPPIWRGSSYASSNAVSGSSAPTRPPRAAALAALTGLPGNPGYNPSAAPRIFASNHWWGTSSSAGREDPLGSHPTPSSRSGHLHRRGLHPSFQQTGYGATDAPVASGSDLQPSTEPSVLEFDDRQYNWRVSPAPDWDTFLAATGVNRSTKDSTAGQEDYAANAEGDQSHVDDIEAHAQHAAPSVARLTQAACPGALSRTQEMV